MLLAVPVSAAFPGVEVLASLLDLVLQGPLWFPFSPVVSLPLFIRSRFPMAMSPMFLVGVSLGVPRLQLLYFIIKLLDVVSRLTLCS